MELATIDTKRPAAPADRLRGLAAHYAARAMRLRAKVDAAGIQRRHARFARKLGLGRVYLVLSFDCDTDEDAAIAWQVHERLANLGVKPVYAVPGELLRRGSDVYTRIAADGSEFLNHGGVEHTYFDEELGRHASNFFYDEQTPDRVRQDIDEGHAIVSDVIGREPRGWRTPHFGTFQSTPQLRMLHDKLRELGYGFSTSTMPRFGLRHGPAFRRFGLPELPVTGVPSAPYDILDTWGFFQAPDRHVTPRDYLNEAQALAALAVEAGAGVINVYGDPVHVHGRDEFFDAVAAWAQVAEPVGYDDLLERMR
jgi:peptidoglycan/xylan/chitin deacetylase (PgdA/CDA1 family)